MQAASQIKALNAVALQQSEQTWLAATPAVLNLCLALKFYAPMNLFEFKT